MAINITVPISVDICQSVLQNGNCSQFIPELASVTGKTFLEGKTIETTHPHFFYTEGVNEAMGRALLKLLYLLKGDITALFYINNNTVQHKSVFIFQDLRNIPSFEDEIAMREFLRTQFNKETEGLVLDEKMRNLLDPEASQASAKVMTDFLRSEKNRETMSKLDELCLVFFKNTNAFMQQESIDPEQVKYCSVYLEADLLNPADQAKEEL